jgi:hypothetical protein
VAVFGEITSILADVPPFACDLSRICSIALVLAQLSSVVGQIPTIMKEITAVMLNVRTVASYVVAEGAMIKPVSPTGCE